jgi:hypothetical protein
MFGLFRINSCIAACVKVTLVGFSVPLWKVWLLVVCVGVLCLFSSQFYCYNSAILTLIASSYHCIVGVESKLGPLGTSAIYWPIVPAPGDCEDVEFDVMNGRRNRSTRRIPAPAPLCPPQIPLDHTRD